MLDLTFHPSTRRADTTSLTPDTGADTAHTGLRSRRTHPVCTWLPVRCADGRVRMEMVWTMSTGPDPR